MDCGLLVSVWAGLFSGAMIVSGVQKNEYIYIIYIERYKYIYIYIFIGFYYIPFRTYLLGQSAMYFDVYGV